MYMIWARTDAIYALKWENDQKEINWCRVLKYILRSIDTTASVTTFQKTHTLWASESWKKEKKLKKKWKKIDEI
jgi:hypothetical protein